MYKATGLAIAFVCCLIACHDPFSYSPFEADLRASPGNLTETSLNRIRQLDTTSLAHFKVALIADSHYHFNDLADAIEDINKKSEYAFIVVVGDLTENGLQKEFEIFQRIMSKSRIPYLTVIGNHDHLSNGATVYQKLFGSLNYTFTFQNLKFVAWDNTVWESENPPDYSWLSEALKNETEEHSRSARSYDDVILISHVPPFDKQFNKTRDQFHGMLLENAIGLSIHGHRHDYYQDEVMGAGVTYVTVGSPQHRAYAELCVDNGVPCVSKIEY